MYENYPTSNKPSLMVGAEMSEVETAFKHCMDAVYSLGPQHQFDLISRLRSTLVDEWQTRIETGRMERSESEQKEKHLAGLINETALQSAKVARSN